MLKRRSEKEKKEKKVKIRTISFVYTNDAAVVGL